MKGKEIRFVSLDELLNSEFYKTGEVAKMLGVSRQAVLDWIKKGQLRAFKVGRSYRIPKADLEEFLRRINET